MATEKVRYFSEGFIIQVGHHTTSSICW